MRTGMPPNAWDALKQILPSEVLDALSNNQPLSPGVLQTARALREQPASSGSAIKGRIKHIKQAMLALREEKDKLSDQGYVRTAMDDAYAALCAPIRRVPDDVLLEVARHSMNDHRHPSPSARNCTPMNLSHVSSRWRNVVINSSSLWTTLYLRLKTVSTENLIKQMQIVEIWFRRAASLPINLFLYVDCKIVLESNEAYNFSQFLKAFAQWTPQLCRLGIGGRHWANLMANFVDIEWDLDNLRELDLLGQQANDEESLQDDMDVLASLQERLLLFRCAKRLASVVVSQEVTFFLRSFAFIPWSQILHVSMLEDLPFGSWLDPLFVKCPNLRAAFLSWPNPNFFDIGHHSTNLEKLELHEITIGDYGELVSFLSRVACPRLTHLAISIAEISELMEEVPVYTLSAVPTFEFLSVLCLEGDTQLPTKFTVDLLRKMPRLQILSMELALSRDHPAATDLNQLCKAMTFSDTQYEFLPLLEECAFQRFGYKSADLLDVTIVSRFISSRDQRRLLPPNCSSLRKVSFLGDFSFMTDLRKEVLRVSSEKPSVEITVLRDRQNSHPQHQPDFQRSPFSWEKNYNHIPYPPDHFGYVH